MQLPRATVLIRGAAVKRQPFTVQHSLQLHRTIREPKGTIQLNPAQAQGLLTLLPPIEQQSQVASCRENRLFEQSMVDKIS